MERQEIWRDILGFEGRYMASNNGRVMSMKSRGVGKPIILKMSIVKGGYRRVTLKGKHCLVQRLVYEAFNGPIPKGMQVNHINEDKSDNRLENLNLMTPKENMNWGTARLRQVMSRTGRDHILTEEERLAAQREAQKRWYKKNYEKNRESILEKQRIYNKEHRQQKSASEKRWREEHKEQVRERQRKYEAEHRDRINQLRRERRARKKNALLAF